MKPTQDSGEGQSQHPIRKPVQEPVQEPVQVPEVSQPVAISKATQPTPTVSGTTMYGADWLVQQDPEFLTVQLAVMSEEIRIPLFIRKHRITGLLSYFPIKRNGTTLFVLTHGLYEDRSAAVHGIKELPPSVRNARPWIRRIADINTQIKGPDQG
jgi:septal ring-binding cell division protein DamX